MSLPVILAMARGSDEERRFWQDAIMGHKNGEEDLLHAKALLEQHGAIADTLERARLYGKLAIDALAPFPDGAAKDALIKLGYPVPDDEAMKGFVGPPLLTGITQVLGVPQDRAVEFRDTYRGIYVETMTQAPLYPGIEELLQRLTHAAGRSRWRPPSARTWPPASPRRPASPASSPPSRAPT